jgi:aminoglycoside phosphotransferase (APT) family kinase protein
MPASSHDAQVKRAGSVRGMSDPVAPTPPPASGSRVPYESLPANLRETIAGRFGSAVVSAESQAGGFSPGVAARVRLADGRRCFIKAAHPRPNAQTPDHHRREATVVAAMPADVPVPRLRWTLDEGPEGWVVLAFDDVAGHQPAVPWQPAELDRVMVALEALTERLTPSPIDPAWLGQAGDLIHSADRGWASVPLADLDRLDAWSRRHLDDLIGLEARVAEAARGSTLLHQDLRADNMLLTEGGVMVVDWPHARVGQPWIDLLWFAPSVAMQGGPEPEALLRRFGPATGADPDAVDSVLAAIAGFFTVGSLLADPPGLPTLRAFQAAQGEIARRWLGGRRGLR